MILVVWWFTDGWSSWCCDQTYGLLDHSRIQLFSGTISQHTTLRCTRPLMTLRLTEFIATSRGLDHLSTACVVGQSGHQTDLQVAESASDEHEARPWNELDSCI